MMNLSETRRFAPRPLYIYSLNIENSGNHRSRETTVLNAFLQKHNIEQSEASADNRT